MPETNDLTASPELQKAAAEFYQDFLKLTEFQKEINQYVKYHGRNPQYDAGLKDLVTRQKKLLFELRNLYADAYDLLPKDKRALVFRWIVQTTGELKKISAGLGDLGLVPLVIVAGVIIAASTGVALIAWHREISNQAVALENQRKMIPLVEAGLVPGELLKPVTPAPGLAGAIGSLGNVVLIGIAIWAAVKFFGGKS